MNCQQKYKAANLNKINDARRNVYEMSTSVRIHQLISDDTTS